MLRNTVSMYRDFLLGAVAAAMGLGLLAGCQSGGAPAKRTIAPTTVDAPVRGRAALERPIELAGHDVVLVPFVQENDKGWFESEDPYGRGLARRRGAIAGDGWLENAGIGVRNGARYVASSVRWHNAFGRDLSTGERWMLLDRRGVISSAALLAPPRSSDPTIYRVLLLATTEDTNGDGRLDILDGRRLWIADGDARNPRPAMPEGTHLVRAWIDWAQDTAYLMVLTDTDGDGAFTDADERAPWSLHLGGVAPAEPLVDEQTVARARALLGG